MTHRARIPAARRCPAGYYPVNAMFLHIVMAGSSIACLACGAEGRLPLPKAEGYTAAVEDFFERHRLCAVAAA